jgi:hypothetical protein
MNKIITILFLCLALTGFAQNKKDVKKYKLKSVTETLTTTENGKEITYIESVTLFNADGKEVSATEYNSDKSIKRQETTTYDKDGNKTQETILKTDQLSKVKVSYKRIAYKYNAAGDKIEETLYDSAGKIVKREVYGYNNLGQKNSVTVYDADGKIIKKQKITFNNKGLKLEKKTYDGSNNLISTKKYSYEYY